MSRADKVVPGAPWAPKLRAAAQKLVMEALLLGLVVYLACTTSNFFTLSNALEVLRQVSFIGVIAFGMTMVIIAGEIDLSVGSAVSFAGCLLAFLIAKGHVPLALAVLIVLAAGFAWGCLSGFLRSRWSVPTFISTLALMTALAGGALRLTNGGIPTKLPAELEWFQFLGGGFIFKSADFAGVPFPVVVFLAVFLVVYFLMNYTSFGRAVYAVGGNAEAARLCGINVTAVRVLVLALTGMLAAVSGIMSASKMMTGDPTAGQGWELDVIAAVIVGGTSISGGAGRIWGTLVGVVFIGVIANGLTMQNVASDAQLIVRGGIILVAVLLSRLQQRRG